MADDQGTRLDAIKDWQASARKWREDNPNPPAGHSHLCRSNCDHVTAPDGSSTKGKRG